MTALSCSQCRDLSDSRGKKNTLVLIDIQKKRTHDVGEGYVLMVVRAVSVPPAVFMEDEDNIGTNINEGFLLNRKLGPVLCKSC